MMAVPAGTVNGQEKADDDLTEEEEMKLEIFRACADRGRKKSLRSLEIPLDNLLSGIIYTAGGRDKRGGPILLLTQPTHLELEALIEITHQEFFDMLAYFTSVPNQESRSLGFSVVVDGEVIHDFLLRIMIKALAIMHSEEDVFHKVYFVSKVRDITIIDWKTEFCNNPNAADLPFQQVNSYKELHKFIDRSRLTSDFGGTLTYSHQDWVRFRMQVEPFLCDCISVSKCLAQAIEPFTEDSIPDSIENVEESIQKHHLIRRKTLEVLHIDELENEGSRIDQHMQHTASKNLKSNPDFANTLSTITNLLNQISSVKERVDTLWTTRHEKLQTSLKQKKFEHEAEKVIEWFEEYAEEFFQTHTELGDSLDVAEALAEEVQYFEGSTQQIISSTNNLVNCGAELEKLPHTDHSTVQPLMGKIKQLVTDFDSRLSKRKKKLDDSVRLHRLTEAALDWCIESASVLSGSDMITSNPADMDSEQVKQELDQFLSSYPPPTDRDIQQLHELTERMESQWMKENALFAYNRVVEVKERFRYYSNVLEEVMEERRQKLEAEKVTEQKSDGKHVRITDVTTIDQISPSTEENQPDGSVPPENKAIATWDSEEDIRRYKGGVKLRRPKLPNSLHYDDTSVGQTLLLLKSVAKSADEQLQSPTYSDDTDTADSKRQSDCASPYHRISKTDISNPTRTAGPLFKTGTSLDSDEEDNLRGGSLSELREKIMMQPCPIEDDLKHQTKHARHRRKLMEELIQTEEVYIRDMEWVVEKYMPTMDNIGIVPRNLVGKKNLIFSTIPQLLQFNKLVIFPQLKMLSKCPIKLGQFFMTLEEDLLNYSLYFKNLPQQTRLMEEGGIEFFSTVSHLLGDRFLLNSYLIKPFQRITKYKIFLEEMIKHSTKADLKGKLKEYYDKLKEAQKMVDFILRHGNDLLAVECLRGYEGNMREHGKILRQGDLTLVEYTKHHRRVFLFENTIILAKKRKPKHHVYDVPGSEVFDFKQEFKTSDYGLRENVDGHPNRFQLYKRKETLTFQAETLEEKNIWVQDIWDLFFSHMLNLKDQNLEAHGSHALTSIVASGTATIGRSFGPSLRRAMSVRHSGRYSRGHRPSSLGSNSSHRHSGGAIVEESTSAGNRLSGTTFVNLKQFASTSSCEQEGSHSNRSSIGSSSSVSTISSCTLGSNGHRPDKSHHLLSSHRIESPIALHRATSPVPSSSPRSPLVNQQQQPVLFNVGPHETPPHPEISSSSSSSLDSQFSLDKTLGAVCGTQV